MTYALMACLALLTIGFLVLVDRKDARATTERNQVIDRLMGEQAAHRREIQNLLQRVQAPELAIAQHAAATAQETPAGAPPVLDEEFWNEHQEHAEYIAKVEAMENSLFDRA